jgi:hypothetical protein
MYCNDIAPRAVWRAACRSALILLIGMQLSCSDSGVTGIDLSANNLPPAQPQEAGFPSGSPAGFPAPENAALIRSQPVSSSADGTRNDDDSRLCIDQLWAFYARWANIAAPFEANREVSCKRIRITDANGSTVFLAELSGRCRLGIELNAGSSELDTAITICH